MTGTFWTEAKDGDPQGFAMYRRHYSSNRLEALRIHCERSADSGVHPMIATPVHGTARLTLTVTTQPKGKKKPLVVTYTVHNLHPDARVANPAFRLTKEDREFYDVHMDSYGPCCTCPHATYRGHSSRVPCKHALALQAVGLMPRAR